MLNQNLNPDSFSMITSIPNIHFVIKDNGYLSIPMIYKNGKFQEFRSNHEITWTHEIDKHSLLMDIINDSSIDFTQNIEPVIKSNAINNQLIININDLDTDKNKPKYLNAISFNRVLQSELFKSDLKYNENIRKYIDFKNHYINMKNNEVYLSFSNNNFEKFLILLINKSKPIYYYLVNFEEIYNAWDFLDDYDLMTEMYTNLNLDDELKIITISKRCSDNFVKYKILYN